MKKLFVFDVLFVLLMVVGIAFEEDMKLGFFESMDEKLTQTSDSFFGIFESEAKSIPQKSEEETSERNFRISENDESLQVTVVEPMKLVAPEVIHSKDGKFAFVIHRNSTGSSMKSSVDWSVLELAKESLSNQFKQGLIEENPQELYEERDFKIQVKCEIQKLEEVIRRSNS